MTKTSSDDLFGNLLPKSAVVSASANEDATETVVAEDEAEAEVAVPAPSAQTELDMLKNRARVMGVKFSNNISLSALKAKIQGKLDGEAEQDTKIVDADENDDDDDDKDEDEDDEIVAAPVKLKAVKKTPYQTMYEEQMKLVRLRITNLNPAKKDLPGEIFTVANKILGAVKKFVPYGEATENGYHVPYFIYTQLKEREFQNIKTRKDSRGRVIVETGMAREFALEVLPPLTERELAQLAAAQSAAKGMD